MRKRVVLMLALAFLIASCLIMPRSVKASSRTIVVPHDYPTLEAAVKNATDGDTILVRAGVYKENPLRINKTLSLVGEGAGSTKLSFDPPYTEFEVNMFEHHIVYENPIEIFANDFQMSGFTVATTGGYISIGGNGTKLAGNEILTDLSVGGSRLNITGNIFPCDTSIHCSNSKISANTGHRMWITGYFCDISENIITSGAGLQFEGDFCLIHDNNMTKAAYGSFSVGGNNNVVYKNIIDDGAYGLAVAGLNNTVCVNRVTNCGEGLCPEAGNTYYANYVANNGWGVYTGDTELNPFGNATTLYHNNFVGNTYQVCTLFKSETDYFDSGEEGNYWSDYHGKDANGDGIGDTPYVIDENRSDRYPLMAPFDIDSVNVELPEWASPPSVNLISPKNATYTSTNITLELTVNKQTSWIGYSLDGQETVAVTGNTTLSGMSSGLHNVTIYAKDVFENIITYETVWFSVADPFPTLFAVAFTVSVVVISLILTIYFKKRKKR